MRFIGRSLFLCTISLAAIARGQTAPAAAPTTQCVYPVAPVVRLWPGDPPATQTFDDGDKLVAREKSTTQFDLNGVAHASLMVYPTKATGGPTPAVIICPGGAYRFEALSGEGIAIAQRFADAGVAAFVLRYRLPDAHAPAAGELPVPQQDVLRAIQLVRNRAADFNVDATRVGVMGFSAGGHLAATAATMYDDAPSLVAKADDAIAHTSARPDFAVLVYPVISMTPGTTHGGSHHNLIGDKPDAATETRFSADKRVTPQTPPLFIVHANDDRTVKVLNAKLMSDAAEAQGVPHTLLLLSRGDHGFGVGRDAQTKSWIGECVAWLQSQPLPDGKPILRPTP